jgi:ATP-dependent DNA helicase RecG
MTVYGDLDVSVLDQLPPGRKPIQTQHFFHNHRNKLNRFLHQEIEKGRQIYVVYPLIEESEKMDYKNLSEGYEYMKKAFPQYEVVMVHGKMKAAEKDEAMLAFASGKAHIMVATTVIEVGVNVPNASVMVIESAERFGLSQLHQLRGRVGRGIHQSYCILISDVRSREALARLRIMCQTSDGFRIADEDLRLRGPGDFFGQRQHGLPSLKIADMTTDMEVMRQAQAAARSILEDDPALTLPEHRGMRAEVKQLFQTMED